MHKRKTLVEISYDFIYLASKSYDGPELKHQSLHGTFKKKKALSPRRSFEGIQKDHKIWVRNKIVIQHRFNINIDFFGICISDMLFFCLLILCIKFEAKAVD